MRTNISPLEYDECRALHDYLRAEHLPHHHIANESQSGTRNGMIRGAKLKAIGQSRGFPDYAIVAYDGETAEAWLLFVEMKRQKGGHLSKEQAEWLSILAQTGALCMVSKGASPIIEFLQWFKRRIPHGGYANLTDKANSIEGLSAIETISSMLK